MEPFATIDDLEAGWRTLDDSERGAAGTLLARASAHLASLLSRSGVEVDPHDEVQRVNLVSVTCNMVKRVMNIGDAGGITQLVESATPYSVSATFSNPNGDWYLSRADKDALGLTGRTSLRVLRPAIRDADGGAADGW